MPRKHCIRSIQAHSGYVRGSVFLPDGEHFLTVGDDKTIKMWETDPSDEDSIQPTDTFLSKVTNFFFIEWSNFYFSHYLFQTVISSISHHQTEPIFATCGEICQLWEETRSEPIRTFQWGVDTLHDVAYNPVQTDIFAACASDRSIIIYDAREIGPVRKVTMKLRANKLCWNPMEAFIFTVANEDYK